MAPSKSQKRKESMLVPPTKLKRTKYAPNDNNNKAPNEDKKDETIKSVPTVSDPGCAKKVPSIEILLPPPIKPPNDPKDYRVIRITSNGTRIILISESNSKCKMPFKVELPYMSDSKTTFIGHHKEMNVDKNVRLQDSCFNCESFRFDKSTKEGSSADPIGPKGDSSRQSKPTENAMISIAVVVGSGYLDEPSSFGGLAHFCEHLVFLGSVQFPCEDQFMSMIRLHGYRLNACTMAESTMYYYEVKEQYLRETLDVFSSFFVDPLFRLDAMKREINAVDHEFRMKRQHDMLIRMEILKHMAKDDHPMRNFSWGDKESLAGDESPEQYEKLRNSLVQFHDTHYVGHNITVAIQGAMSLDDLQEVAVSYFSKLRPGKVREDIPKRLKDPYDTPAFNSRYRVKPVGALEYIYLTWALPKKFWCNYETKPLAYLSSVISSEISGGLVDYLKNKNWIMDLCSGLQFQSRTKYGVLFVIKMFITDEGYKNQDNIIESVFGYLEALRRQGPNSFLYRDMQQVRAGNMAHYGNNRPPLLNVKKMASSMHTYSSQDIISGETKFYKFDPYAIEDALDSLTVDNLNIMVFAHGDEDSRFHQIEPRTACPYDVQPFNKKLLCLWGKGKLWTMFCTPCQSNPYKTINFSSLNHQGVTPTIVPLVNSQKLVVQYVPIELEFPFSSYKVIVQSKGGRSTGRRQAMLHLLTSILRFELRQEMGFAKDAGIMSSIEPGNGSLHVCALGYDKMSLKLVQDIMSKVFKLKSSKIDEDYFNTSREFLLKLVHFLLMQPTTLALNLFHQLKFWGEQSLLAMHAALVDIQFSDFKAFASDFMKEFKIYMIAVGNTLESDVQQVTNNFLKHQYNPLKDFSPFLVERSRVVQLPNLQLHWRVESFNKNASTSMILNYYQMINVNIGDNSQGPQILGGLLMRMMSQPFFTQLRTQKCLGYQVGCALNYDAGVLGACFLVCTDAEIFSVDLVNKEIDSFIQQFYDENIKNITVEEFQALKTKYYQYPLKGFTHNHLKEFFEIFLLPTGRNYRKASVQVTGHPKCKSENGQDPISPKNSSFKQVMELSTYKFPIGQDEPENIHYIQNIDLLHMYLNLYGR